MPRWSPQGVGGELLGDSWTASSTFQTEDGEATHEERALEEDQAARWSSQKDLLRDNERSIAPSSGGEVRPRRMIDIISVWVGRESPHFRGEAWGWLTWSLRRVSWRGRSPAGRPGAYFWEEGGQRGNAAPAVGRVKNQNWPADLVTRMEVTSDLHGVFCMRGGESQTVGAGQGVVGEEVKSP